MVFFFVMHIIISHHKFNRSGLLATDSSCQGAKLNINVGQHGTRLPCVWPSLELHKHTIPSRIRRTTSTMVAGYLYHIWPERAQTDKGCMT